MGFLGAIAGSLAGSSGDILGGIGGSAVSGYMANKAADKAYKRQIEMYQNRHQWEIEDLKKAGLNPILSAKYGGGSFPSVQKADVPDFGKNITSALVMKKMKHEMALLNEQTRAAGAGADIASIDAVEKKIIHNKLYGGRDDGEYAARTSDYPRSIRGPVRSTATAVDNLVNSARTFFKRLKGKSATAQQRRNTGISEKELIDRIYAPYRKKTVHDRAKAKQYRDRKRWKSRN